MTTGETLGIIIVGYIGYRILERAASAQQPRGAAAGNLSGYPVSQSGSPRTGASPLGTSRGGYDDVSGNAQSVLGVAAAGPLGFVTAAANILSEKQNQVSVGKDGHLYLDNTHQQLPDSDIDILHNAGTDLAAANASSFSTTNIVLPSRDQIAEIARQRAANGVTSSTGPMVRDHRHA